MLLLLLAASLFITAAAGVASGCVNERCNRVVKLTMTVLSDARSVLFILLLEVFFRSGELAFITMLISIERVVHSFL